MHAPFGRIEQAGTPEELYDRPNSEFVAQFLGGSNVLRGRAADNSHVQVGPLSLRCGHGAFAAGQPGALSIRHHHVELSAQKPAEDRNVSSAKVDRKSTRLNSSHMSESRMPSSA